MTLNDRFTKGVIAGTIAGLALNVETLTFYYLLKATTLRWLDWAAILAFGRKPSNPPETIVAFFMQLAFSSFLGVVFAYLIPKISSKNIYFKGPYLGLAVLFFLLSIVHLFKVPGLTNQPFGNITTNIIAVITWGFMVAFGMNFLDKKIKDKF